MSEPADWRDLWRRNAFLLAVLAASLAIFVAMTLPAIERNREVLALERERAAELAEAERELRFMDVYHHALETRDPSLLERALQERYEPAPAPAKSAPQDPVPPPPDGR